MTLAAIDHIIAAHGIGPPDRLRRGLFVRAALTGGHVPSWLGHCSCEQTFRPEYDALVKAGLTVTRDAQGEFAIAICRLVGDRDHDLANIARAYDRIAPGGTLLVGGEKNAGAASIEAKLRRHHGLEGSDSKHHCRVFWLKREHQTLPDAFSDWQAGGEIKRSEATGLFAAPGTFGHDKIDEGSALLAKYLGARLGGRVGDLGSGNGYLSLHLLARSPAVHTLDLYEAEHLAIDAASRALDLQPAKSRQINIYWHDVTTGIHKSGYDWIVTNPPFHYGRRTDFDVGRAFIRCAAAALRRDGRMLMVANNHLPYDAVLNSSFGVWRECERSSRFRVIEAWSPFANADALSRSKRAPQKRKD